MNPRRLAAALVVVGVTAGILLVARGGSGDGPLSGDEGNEHGSRVDVGVEYDSFSIGLQNDGDEPIEIERVRLTDVSGPVELVGVRTRYVPEDGPPGGGGRVGDPGVSTVSFPLPERSGIPVPTSFFETGNPAELLQILFRVKMTAEGIGVARGVKVDYRSGGRSYTEAFEWTMVLCAPRSLYLGEGVRRCGPGATRGDRVLG